MRNLRTIGLCSLLAALAACSDGPGPGSDACPQTFEFGNFGCARIRGTVRNGAGQPLIGAQVSVVPPSGTPNSYDSPFVDTDATGLYSIEIHQYASPDTIQAADTVPMYLRAFLPSDGSPIGDSVLVQMIFAPVDSMPNVVEADITLD
jgi:hypothetical protein